MKELITYKCPICGNMAVMIEHSGVNPVCCGKPMQLLPANMQDASFEKHIPVITQQGKDVYIKIGEDAHPMTEEHFILWIAVLTDRAMYMRTLRKIDFPEAHFSINTDEDVTAAYAYCNLHGLWVKEQPPASLNKIKEKTK